MRRRFLQLALLNVVYGLSLATLGVVYHGHVHLAGNVAIGAVLAVYALAVGYALQREYRGQPIEAAHLELAVAVLPMIAMLGTVSGFLIAFSGGTGDVEQRVLGASTGLASTFVGIASAVVLMVQAHMLKPKSGGCGCR